ncbi:MAG: hypothetical protein AAGE52_09765 [Myxococcota bacterium]
MVGRASLLVALVLASAATAQDGDPLARTDPLEVQREVARLGDDAVRSRLQEGPVHERLSAIRAVRWLTAPEAALGDLVTLAGSDDPRLAPAAAIALWRVSTSLDPRELSDREAAMEELQSAAEALATVSADESLRPDLRRLLEIALTHLRSLVE